MVIVGLRPTQAKLDMREKGLGEVKMAGVRLTTDWSLKLSMVA